MARTGRGSDYGNKFLRVSASFGTGFSGEWGFRAESRAFHGALVLAGVELVTPLSRSAVC